MRNEFIYRKRRIYFLTLSSLDILELPMGCSAKSEELLFQASFRKKFNSDFGDFGKNPIISHNPSYSLKNNNNTKVKIVESNVSKAIEKKLDMIISNINNNEENRTIIRSYDQSLDQLEQEDRERVLFEKNSVKEKIYSTFQLVIAFTCTLLFSLLLFFIGCPIIRQKYTQLNTDIKQEINDTKTTMESRMDKKLAQLSTRIRKLEQWKISNDETEESE